MMPRSAHMDTCTNAAGACVSNRSREGGVGGAVGAPALSWADKARGLPLVACRKACSDIDEEGNVDRTPAHGRVEEESHQFPQNRVLSLPGNIAPDLWELICSYLNFPEVVTLSSSCAALWKLICHHRGVWCSQLEYFKENMKSLHGEERMLCSQLLSSAPRSLYEKMKLEVRLHAMDTRREWYLKEHEKIDGPLGVFSCPLTLCHSSYHGDALLDDNFESLSQLRVVRAVSSALLEVATSAHLQHSFSGTPSTFNPSEYMALCDHINHGDFTGSRIGIEEFAEGDELLQFALLQTLNRAKCRHCSIGSGCISRHTVLRPFSGMLLSICRQEAEDILQSLLHKRDVLDDFVAHQNWGQGAVHANGNPDLQLQMRYFIAPELCRRGRMGLIIVDPIRLLVIVGRECVARGAVRWSDEFIL
uniref:F-box domain-containing protein n=1 Tax=Trypanosoma congolense (strain IL3000) TaxID=1068625 RepID=G0UXV6_TRYCI|nr:conserved hypothetical protein [Trypanosoma congolense IL3000]